MCSEDDLAKGVVVRAKEQRILSTGIYKNSVEHKYSYRAVIYCTPAWGLSSIKNHIGIFCINPSTEYIGGGAERLDLVAHVTACRLDYWTSGHYGGGPCCSIPEGGNLNQGRRANLFLLRLAPESRESYASRPGRTESD